MENKHLISFVERAVEIICLKLKIKDEISRLEIRAELLNLAIKIIDYDYKQNLKIAEEVFNGKTN